MYQEKLPNKLYLPMQMKKKTVGQPKTTADESNITLRILGGIVWDFTQAK